MFPEKPSIVYQDLVGTPWVGICDYAKQAGIDLIVIATHGLTGLHHVLMLALILVYVMTDNLSLRPGKRAIEPMPAATAP
jgi:hypothetical protein